MLSKGAELPRQPPTHPEETEEELTETNDMQEEDGGAGLHRWGSFFPSPTGNRNQRGAAELIGFPRPTRLQRDGSEDSAPSSERLGAPGKGEEEHAGVHVKGESTESDLDEEEEDEDAVQLREGDEEEMGSYSKVCCPVFSLFAFKLYLKETKKKTFRAQCD